MRDAMKLDEILRGLGLDTAEIDTYSFLLMHGPTGAGQLAGKVGLARSSLYGVLNRLCERGLISESLDEKTKIFIAEPPDKLGLIFGRKIEALAELREEFRKILPDLKKNNKRILLKPRLEMLRGAEGLQSVLKDMLLYHDLQTFALWPIRSMLKVLSPEFFRYLNKERILNNLYTRAIWPADHGVNLKSHPYLGVGEGFKREIRVAPAGVEFPMGYWSYGRKTAFISSEKESFGFLIESDELSLTLKAQFDPLWNISTPLQSRREDTEMFLEELTRYTGVK